MPRNIILRLAMATGAVLLIPAVAMQFTDQVAWGPFDFVFMGALLFGAGLTFELMTRRRASMTHRAAVGLAVVTALFLIWVNAAVGIIGGEENPANLLYGGVLAAGFFGAIISGLKPRGMARTLFVMAALQILVPVIAQLFWPDDFAPSVAGVFALNALFAGLFLGSGLLFKNASRESTAGSGSSSQVPS